MSNLISEKLSVEGTDKNVGLITINRPESYNSLHPDVIADITSAARTYNADHSVCLIAITGAGKAFSAGGDLKLYRDLIETDGAFNDYLEKAHALFSEFESVEKPLIALINGYCVAGGLELLLACDFAYASRSARIGDGHANWAIVGGYGSQSRLPKRIGIARALEMIYTARLIDAGQALDWGLVNKVVPEDQLIAECLSLGAELAGKSMPTCGVAKKLAYDCLTMTDEEALRAELEVSVQQARSSEMKKGLEAFINKTVPVFS